MQKIEPCVSLYFAFDTFCLLNKTSYGYLSIVLRHNIVGSVNFSVLFQPPGQGMDKIL